MKPNEKDLEQIIHNILNIYDLDNQDLECLETKQSLTEMIFTLYQECNSVSNTEIIKDKINTMLDIRIKVIPPEYNDNDIKELNKIIDHLKQTPQPAQRTPEWYEFRNQRLTASDLATAVDKNPYSTRNKLIMNKCGIKEEWNPGPAIIHGVKYEDVAVAIYELRNDVNVVEYGCIPHPTISCFGASPDGIVDTNSHNKNYIGRMLEIKCPTRREITGFIPKYYYHQVQGQLEVCNLKYCDFLECKISEYNSKDDYFQDGDFEYTKNGKEKGIIIEVYNHELEKIVYNYANIGTSLDEFLKWEENIIDDVLKDSNLEYIQTSFWKLDEYNCLLIEKNEEFWEETKPKILKFWEDVLLHRDKGCDDIAPKKKNTVKKPPPDKLHFLDDSD
jgi:putative phage-type endonuclease